MEEMMKRKTVVKSVLECFFPSDTKKRKDLGIVYAQRSDMHDWYEKYWPRNVVERWGVLFCNDILNLTRAPRSKEKVTKIELVMAGKYESVVEVEEEVQIIDDATGESKTVVRTHTEKVILTPEQQLELKLSNPRYDTVEEAARRGLKRECEVYDRCVG